MLSRCFLFIILISLRIKFRKEVIKIITLCEIVKPIWTFLASNITSIGVVSSIMYSAFNIKQTQKISDDQKKANVLPLIVVSLDNDRGEKTQELAEIKQYMLITETNKRHFCTIEYFLDNQGMGLTKNVAIENIFFNNNNSSFSLELHESPRGKGARLSDITIEPGRGVNIVVELYLDNKTFENIDKSSDLSVEVTFRYKNIFGNIYKQSCLFFLSNYSDSEKELNYSSDGVKNNDPIEIKLK